MRRKYNDCVRLDGDCTHCERVVDMKDCRGRRITKMEWARLRAGMGLSELSAKSGVAVRQIQKVELGEGEAGNMTARNILEIAKALDTTPENLI